MVWKMRQTIEFQKSRIQAQGLLAQKDADDDTIKKVFEELKEAFFPFDRNEKMQESKQAREQLMREISRGPLLLTPLGDPSYPKNRSSLERGRQELAKRLSMEASGQSKEMDVFQKAQRRPRGAS